MPGYRIVLKPLEVDHNRVSTQINKLRSTMQDPSFQNQPQMMLIYKRHLDSLQKKLKTKGERVIDADFAKVIDGGTLLVGIGPASRTVFLRGFMGNRRPNSTPPKKRKERDIEFYNLKGWNHEANGGRGAYELERKFEKILSINVDNVISINGKPLMSRLDNLDRGVQQLGLDEDWSIDNISDMLED
jgi:hypothetical protein